MWGLSPLARGNLGLALANGDPVGSIPARAGEPAQMLERPSTCRVYPRSRGGTGVVQEFSESHIGLSPLARGNLGTDSPVHASARSIPARAGEPTCAAP